jgi:hypothetical protein
MITKYLLKHNLRAPLPSAFELAITWIVITTPGDQVTTKLTTRISNINSKAA